MSLIDKYTDSNSCLFINPKNQIFRVYCPFRVLCKSSTQHHKRGQIYLVRQVISNNDQSILYCLGNNTYPHNHFKLVI